MIKMSNDDYLNMFISAKDIEGCSSKTLKYYKDIILKFIRHIEKPIKEITTDDIRLYFADYKNTHTCSTATMDNIRRVFSSFFAWLEDEDYILKSPVRRIHRVKSITAVKEAFSDENIEVLRDNCKTIRELALLELLLSTGMRVGELVNLNISDMNFEDRSCIVLGKGNKQREVYFDARTKLHLKEYLATRTDDNEALFVSNIKPHQRLTISTIEYLMRVLGKKVNIKKVHPHRCRRTVATVAIDKGMPIEQVQKLLGHTKIDTTLHYAMVNQTNVKFSHRKYIG